MVNEDGFRSNLHDKEFNPNDVIKDPTLRVIPEDTQEKAHDEVPVVERSLPIYECFKKVCALKIKDIEYDVDAAIAETRETDGTAMIVPEEEGYGKFKVSNEYVRKHQPKAGGYWIKYEDGYESWSPAEVFEAGYKLI